MGGRLESRVDLIVMRLIECGYGEVAKKGLLEEERVGRGVGGLGSRVGTMENMWLF